MTEKEKALVEALCDAYGIDYPEQGDNGDDEDMRSDEEIYFDKENSYSFTSGCYINHEWLSLANIIRIVREQGLLEEDDF